MDPEEPDDQRTLRLYTEAEDGSTVVLAAMPKRHHYKERFATMFVSRLETIAKWDRPPVYHRVMMHLLATLDPVQFRVTSASKVAEACHVSVVSASRALAMLAADRVIIERGSKAQRERRLNNTMAWASTAAKHNVTDPDLPIEDGRLRQ